MSHSFSTDSKVSLPYIAKFLLAGCLSGVFLFVSLFVCFLMESH